MYSLNFYPPSRDSRRTRGGSGLILYQASTIYNSHSPFATNTPLLSRTASKLHLMNFNLTSNHNQDWNILTITLECLVLIVLPAFAGKRQDLGAPEPVSNLKKKKKINHLHRMG